MNFSIRQASAADDARYIRELNSEYMGWVFSMLNQTYGTNYRVIDIENKVETDLLQLAQYMPPRGRLLLCYADEALAGMACLRDLGMQIGEIKRMFIRPAYRRYGCGRMLLDQLISEATSIGYRTLRLDSARFMEVAHQLYLSAGFNEIMPYEASEIPKEAQSAWIFMEKELA